jgi:hypothetical protein
MIYQACISPGRYPRQHKAILMMESAVHRPTLIHTIDRKLASSESGCFLEARLQHVVRTCDGWEEDGQNTQEDVCTAHYFEALLMSQEMRCFLLQVRSRQGLRWMLMRPGEIRKPGMTSYLCLLRLGQWELRVRGAARHGSREPLKRSLFCLFVCRSVSVKQDRTPVPKAKTSKGVKLTLRG